MENNFRITINRQVIKLLGEHLYGDTPSIINELIANSYDARAKNIWIEVKTTPPCQIIVEDDGVGMNVDEVNNYFLNIGYNRRQEQDLQNELTSLEARSDMGQKGIGKLAAFALSKNINVFSKKANFEPIGLNLDFDIITTDDGQPTAILDVAGKIKNEHGTRIELLYVTKDLAKSYKYLVSHIARSFFLNDESIKISIKKNTENFAELKRSTLELFNDIDCLITIGNHDRIHNIKNKVLSNSIDTKYKEINAYEDLEEKDKFPPLPIKLQVYDTTRKTQKNMDFSFYGWIGTVHNADAYKKILVKSGYSDDELKDKDITVIDDNRVTIYSRGKVGEYNILSKIKSSNANDAYILGEIYVDDFEKDGFIDMATSNRRGYQEDDPRYECLEKILKRIVTRIVNNKQRISKKIKDDLNEEEVVKIHRSFQESQIKSKPIFDKLTTQEKSDVQYDFHQFSRAMNLSNSKKRILISHRSFKGENDEPRNDYGEFLLKVIEKINPRLGSEILFTSSLNHGIPNGKDIYDYLKDCFREDLFVIFIFNKSFYDSNMCISEAGAAWATNKKYSIMCVDLAFSEIDKPINRGQVGIQIKWPMSTTDLIYLKNELTQNILPSVDKVYDDQFVMDKITEVISDYHQNSQVLYNPIYIPSRKFLVYPVCPTCNEELEIKIDNQTNDLYYECSCGMKYNAKVR